MAAQLRLRLVPEMFGANRVTLAATLERMGEGAINAMADGRAFINGVRATCDVDLSVGDVVEVWDARRAGSSEESFEVVFHDRRFVIAQKPAELATVADHRGTNCLVSEVEAWLSEKRIEGEAHPVSRLDVGVSGVVLFALSPASRNAVLRASELGKFQKRYVAIVNGKIDGEGIIDSPIESKRSPGGRAKPQTAKTRYKTLARVNKTSLVLLEPITGRTHQLRIHLARQQAPIFGDRVYGGATRFTRDNGSVIAIDRIMLHAIDVRLELHAVDVVRATAPVPTRVRSFWASLGGDPSVFDALIEPPA